jgi:hypothetical protein
MLPFQREIFKTELRNKLEHWKSPASRAAFYGNLPTNTLFPDFGIVRDSAGYFYLREDFVAYYNLTNGHIIRMKKNWSLKDWECYQELYNKSVELGTFRIDAPLYREEVITSDGSKWEYAELQSPGNAYGTNLFDEAFQDVQVGSGNYMNEDIFDTNKVKPEVIPSTVRESVTEYVKRHIDDTYTIAHQSILIAETKRCGILENLGNIPNRYKDANGFFWSDLDQGSWTTSKTDFLSNALVVLELALEMLKSVGHLTAEQQNECVNYAREKWTTI